MASRIPQIVLISSFLYTSWLGMQICHELGHVIGALLTGADIQRVYLHPLEISRTELLTNPHPLFVVWMGPVIGALLPFFVFIAAKICQAPKLYMYRFFSGFCLISNGLYIGFGMNLAPLDTGVMIALGVPRLSMTVFGLITVPFGLYLWHDQGRFFGFGASQRKVEKNAVMISVGMLIFIILVEILYTSYYIPKSV